MALKVLLLRNKLDASKKKLEELRTKDADFETREAELEAAINEMTEETSEEDRKVVENSTDIMDLIKNPNKFTFIILGVLAFVVVLLVLLYLWFRKISRKFGIITKVRELKTTFNKVKKITQKLKK